MRNAGRRRLRDRRESSSGAEGLKALEKQDFDLLLSDLMMPGMDGIQVLRKALEIDPNLVGIIMTGQGTIPTAVEAMKVGAFDYVLKPFNLQTMLPILARAMDVRRLRTENVRSAPVRRAAHLRVAALPDDRVRPGHAAGHADDRKGRPDRRHGPGPRPERHGQGAGRAGPARQQPASRPAAGHRQLCRLAGNPAGK